jgi:hypothetical protein
MDVVLKGINYYWCMSIWKIIALLVLYLVSIMPFCLAVDATKNNKICTILFLIFWFDSSMEFYFSFLVSHCMFPVFLGCVSCFVPL